MGAIFSKIQDFIKTKKESDIIIIGLDNAGKTCILLTLTKPGKQIMSLPTIGFNVDTIKINNVNIRAYDLGGQNEIRVLWKEYLQTAKGIVFVVDFDDVDRYSQAAEWLHKSVDDAAKNGKQVPLLVLANKVDNPNKPELETEVAQLCHALKLQSLKGSWKVFTTSTITSIENPNPLSNILKSFEWLVNAIDREDS
ncbi:ADP-ribosylation factor [Cucumispora dikerogammari]|nr:ADP-ribosylation factor [Cucumispora dikerogammari]